MTVSARLASPLLAVFALPFLAGTGLAQTQPPETPAAPAAPAAEVVPPKPKPVAAKPKAPAKATTAPTVAAKPVATTAPVKPATPAAKPATAQAKPTATAPKPAATAPKPATTAAAKKPPAAQPERLVIALGKPVAPTPAMLEAVKALRDAAAAGDPEAVFARIADDVTFVSSGTTLGVARSVEMKGPFADGPTALETIGFAYESAVVPPAPGAPPVDPTTARIRRALGLMVATIDDARWSTDPLVPGATCTAPGAKWNVALAKKSGLASARGGFVLTDTVLRADRKASAKPVQTLKPGTIVRAELGGGGDWEKVTLPPDKLAWAPPRSLRTATPWGFCFLPTAEGDWLLSAVVSTRE